MSTENESTIWPPVNGICVFSKPEDQVVQEGQTACFVVTAWPANLKATCQSPSDPADSWDCYRDAMKQDPPLKFQWLKDGRPLKGATGPSLIIESAGREQSGFYSVVVTTAGGAWLAVGGTNSDAPGARLFVHREGSIITQGPFLPGAGTKLTCPGTYKGKVTFLNPSNPTTTWFLPEAGKNRCRLTDISGFPLPYTAKIEAVDNRLNSWCGSSPLKFPIRQDGTRYQFTIFVTNCPPPNQGDPLQLQIDWLV